MGTTKACGRTAKPPCALASAAVPRRSRRSPWRRSRPPADGLAASRIKDIADVEGVRDNVLIGYGLVVGLNGTGDSVDDMTFTKESLIAMLERLGINTRDGKVDADNIAAVMVTGTLPPFGRQGSRVDVTVSAMGDAKSLQGGTLLVTPLIGADGEVYAVAQGNVAIGGFSASGQGQSVVKGVPTSGRIANGAIIEREIPFSLNAMRDVKLALRNPDFTTARRIAQAVNAFLGTRSARAIDPRRCR
jgi:flagellar P-ring protein precursor FlgI